MTVIGTQDFAPDVLVVVVDADPTVTAVDAPRGSLIIFKPGAGVATYFTKDDDGSSTNVTALGGAGGGAWTAVNKQTLGADAAVVDVVGLDATAQLWEIRFRLSMAIADSFALRIRTGGAFKTAFEYLFHVAQPKHTATAYAAVASIGTEDRIKVSGLVAGATVARSAQGTIRIYDPGNTVSRKQIMVDVGFFDSAGAFASVKGWGVWDAGNGAVDQVRFFGAAQDIAAGSEFALFKRADFS